MGNATLVRVERVEIKGWSGSIHLESNNRPLSAAKPTGSYAYLISQEEYHRLVAASERLEMAESRVQELERLLHPMAEEARMWMEEWPGDRPLFHRETTPSAITLGDCRRARASLSEIRAPDAPTFVPVSGAV